MCSLLWKRRSRLPGPRRLRQSRRVPNPPRKPRLKGDYIIVCNKETQCLEGYPTSRSGNRYKLIYDISQESGSLSSLGSFHQGKKTSSSLIHSPKHLTPTKAPLHRSISLLLFDLGSTSSIAQIPPHNVISREFSFGAATKSSFFL